MNHSSRGLLRKFIHLRQFHTTKVKLIDPKTVEEVRIPVPWGHIAGKWWGCKKSPLAAIAVHGLLDNANSFDKVLPLIDISNVLCIDLPGHGQSSHVPKGLHIQFTDYVTALRYIIKYHYKREKITIIGHSYGSSICTAYCGIFPETVDKLVTMECSRLFRATTVNTTVDEFRTSIEDYLSFEESDRQSEGRTLEARMNHLYKVREQLEMPVSKESCMTILERGTNTVGDNLKVLSYDPRLQFRTLGRFTKSMVCTYGKRLTMDILYIMASNGFYTVNPAITGFNFEENERSIKDIQKVARKFIFKLVRGYHHAIMDEPGVVAEIINDFLHER